MLLKRQKRNPLLEFHRPKPAANAAALIPVLTEDSKRCVDPRNSGSTEAHTEELEHQMFAQSFGVQDTQAAPDLPQVQDGSSPRRALRWAEGRPICSAQSVGMVSLSQVPSHSR